MGFPSAESFLTSISLFPNLDINSGSVDSLGISAVIKALSSKESPTTFMFVPLNLPIFLLNSRLFKFRPYTNCVYP